ncbi:MAG: aminoacetone oxidase family FAD-binding enzyme [Elusimicrobia bacterium]|nr:aminoacetone oxidase family FAD-binding enzyme [Elusimicrobiota bacterium]
MGHRVIIVGAGASGLAAAIAAGRSTAQVTLLERGHSLGRKILASGGGRCNLGNSRMALERYHGAKPAFIREALSRFKTDRFFSELGLLTVTEPDGRIFPRCGKAHAVLDVLKAELERLGVTVRLGTEAAAVEREGVSFIITTAAVPWKKDAPAAQALGPEKLGCDRLILACGGASYPQLGGGENGYGLAKSLGHSVTGLSPALVPLLVKDNAVKRLHGLRVEAGLRVLGGQRELCRSRGEVLFTDYGLSGPAALDVSREAVQALAKGPVAGSLDLFPEFTPQGLRALVIGRWAGRPKRPLKDFFLGMFPAQLAGAIIDSLGWDANRPLDSLGRDACERLAVFLQDWRFEVAGARGWNEAMVTAGGVSADEVDPRGFASRKAAGLHLTGEMLDVDGDSGGYNLHFAWASGLAAGSAAASAR